MTLRTFIMGFRGDWKALRQVFNFNRFADPDQAGAPRRKDIYGFIVTDLGVDKIYIIMGV